MPEDFAADFDAPVIETISGEPVEFPILDIDADVPRLAAHWRYTRKQARLGALGDKATPHLRAAVAAEADSEIPVMDALAQFVYTQPGAFACLEISLQRAGKKPDEAKKIVRRLYREKKYDGVVTLAGEVSGFFPSRNGKAEAKETPDPLTGPGGAPGDSMTGS